MATLAAIRAARLYSPWDRRSLPAYILIAAMAGAGLCLCLALGFSISGEIFPQFFGMPLMAILGGWGLRRLGKPNFGGAMEVLGLIFLQGLAAFFLIAPLAAISAPLADPWLARGDQAIGFDWVSFARAVNGPVAGFFYRSFSWQPALVAFAVFLSRQPERGWRFLFATVAALAISALLFPLAPAVGSSLHYGIAVASAAKPFAAALLELRAGHRVLDNSVFAGLISFPSCHAAAAVLFAWACWTTRLRWPVLLLNVAMTVSAITIGSHYLIDIVAGLVVGAVAIKLSRRVVADAAVGANLLR